jgi:phytoene dehydrogenase-like protein
MSERVDAVVIGSGPNGLAAAIEVARAGKRVIVFEADDTVGGGARTGEATLPGFRHDLCSAVHPFAAASPFFRTLPLASFGLQWIESPAALAHPLGDRAALAFRSIGETAATLGADARAYRRLMTPLVRDWPQLESMVMGPVALPRHPLAQAKFGLQAVRSARSFARSAFEGDFGCGLFAGIAAHGMLPLDQPLTAGVGLTLGILAHVVGWPIPRGGAQAISDALAAYLRSLGGEIVTGFHVRSLSEIPESRVVLCDISPKPLLQIAADRFPASYRKRLERYRYGAAAFKIDWALGGPIPWTAAECAQAATVHLGGTLSEIERSEWQVSRGETPEQPFVLLSQPSLFDSSRAPSGKHVAWGYCHVPNGSTREMTECIEMQIERFAPGFRQHILARHVMSPASIEKRNPNFVGGDIGSGAVDWRQFFARPTAKLYSTPAAGVYICSAATPPGVGVHGMCGYNAARRALRRELK